MFPKTKAGLIQNTQGHQFALKFSNNKTGIGNTISMDSGEWMTRKESLMTHAYFRIEGQPQNSAVRRFRKA